MKYKKGFSLIEIIIVLVIVGVLAAIAIPNYMNSAEQAKAGTARSNLMAIAAAQQKYYEDNSAYCTATTPAANCGDSFADLSSNLRLSLGTDAFTYSCSVSAVSPPFTCTASDTKDTLVLSMTTQTINGNLIVTGSTISCTAGGSACPPGT